MCRRFAPDLFGPPDGLEHLAGAKCWPVSDLLSIGSPTLLWIGYAHFLNHRIVASKSQSLRVQVATALQQAEELTFARGWTILALPLLVIPVEVVVVALLLPMFPELRQP